MLAAFREAVLNGRHNRALTEYFSTSKSCKKIFQYLLSYLLSFEKTVLDFPKSSFRIQVVALMS